MKLYSWNVNGIRAVVRKGEFVKFIEKHQYFTNTARRLRNVNKNIQLQNIRNWMQEVEKNEI